ncbi:MAG: CapA family protein [Clostridia bacterium]|nr:CapA family protein [Clostridia bacterium]
MNNTGLPHFGPTEEAGKNSPDKLTLKQKIQISKRRIRPIGALLSVLLFIALFAGMVGANALLSANTVTPPSSIQKREGTTTIDFVGDIMLGRNIMEMGEYSGYEPFFEGITEYWKNDDLSFGNIECSVLNGEPSEYDGDPAYGNILLYTKYSAIDAVRKAGLTAFSCANNHFYDYGDRATREFIGYLDRNGVIYSGIGRDNKDAARYTVIELNGKKIAYIAIDDVYYLDEVAGEGKSGVLATAFGDYTLLVYNAAQEADLTIVYMHWGDENDFSVNKDQTVMAHMLIDAGADVIVGAHPHVLQRVEKYHGGTVFYSLGNFIFDQGNTFSKDTAMVRMTYDADGKGEFRVIPFRINDFTPRETGNGYYKSRIFGRFTEGLDEKYYSYDENGYLVIPFELDFTDRTDDTGS